MTAEAELDGFIDKFSAEIAGDARFLLARLRARIPGATIMVYDNYNALAIAFGSAAKLKAVALSLAVYPRWCSVFLMGGPSLPDPHGLLAGEGGTVRHIRMTPTTLIDDPRVDALIAAALARLEPPIDPAGEEVLVVKSVSAKQRARR